MQQTIKVVPKNGYYIAGFVDGEGSFNVSLKHRPDYQLNWKVAASFNVSQKDRVILAWIKKHLKCGTLRTRNDGVVYYEVTNIHALFHNVLPFFKKFTFISAKKKRDFNLFSSIVDLMYHKHHHTKKGLLKVVHLREQLNVGAGRTRKYSENDVLSSFHT